MDPQELVVLADSVGSTKRAGLDLADAGRDGEVCDRTVFRFAAPVTDDGRPAGPLGHIDRVERLRQSPDLVELDQNRIGAVEFDAFG